MQPGRPAIGPQISPRVPQGDLDRLDALAAETSTTRADQIRTAISQHLNTHETLNRPIPAPATLATDLARIHASIIRLHEERDTGIEPDFLTGYSMHNMDLSEALALAQSLGDVPDGIPQILSAYQAELESDPEYAKANIPDRAHTGRDRVIGVDSAAGSLDIHWRGTDIQLRWEAPGQVTVTCSEQVPILGWGLLLDHHTGVDKDRLAREILKEGPFHLDWIAVIDDYCDLGGLALGYATQTLARWAPHIEVTRPRRVRVHQLTQARILAAAGLRPVLATPGVATVVVTSEHDALQQDVHYHPFPKRMLERTNRYGAHQAASELTEMVRGGYGHKPEAQGSARYTADHVASWQGTKKTVTLITDHQRWSEEFIDGDPASADLLAMWAYPGAYVGLTR